MVALKTYYDVSVATKHRGFANATNGSTPETENATLSLIRTANQLMLELWPGDPFCGA